MAAKPAVVDSDECQEAKEPKEPNLRAPWTGSDVVFLVEEKNIYANKAILSIWSPVFRTMFSSDFKEKRFGVIALPGKIYDEVLTLFELCHVPLETVTNTNVEMVLHLANEYQMKKILDQCETVLLSQTMSLEKLFLAKQYGFASLEETCTAFVKKEPLANLSEERFDDLGYDICNEILKFKVKCLEPLVPLLRKLRDVTLPDKLKNPRASEQQCIVCNRPLSHSEQTSSHISHVMVGMRRQRVIRGNVMCSSCALSRMGSVRAELQAFIPDKLFD